MFAICQLRLTIASNQWYLYWMRKFDAWWPYPLPKTGTNSTRIHTDETDSHGFFVFICVHPCDPC
ncbi:MAG: DUF3024 domain-containing protein [Anaerolineae bacterium]|nr:DUF3024 domain-containing protein [Anaerolineae bacterium]